MIHPVTVKDASGKIKYVITSESLDARSTAICMDSGGHFASQKMREERCGRYPVCTKPLWTKQRGKKYCSPECAKIVGRATALKTKERRKLKLKKEKEISNEKNSV